MYILGDLTQIRIDLWRPASFFFYKILGFSYTWCNLHFILTTDNKYDTKEKCCFLDRHFKGRFIILFSRQSKYSEKD